MVRPPTRPSAEQLMALTAELVDRPSVSFQEGPIVEWLEAELRSLGHLEVTRLGDNLVARTTGNRPHRVMLAGHTDTVPPHGNEVARRVDDVLWGLGSADMKSGLACMLWLARAVPEPVVDLTYVLYAREEVAGEHNGLAELYESAPELLDADVAILGEPTGAAIEAGCQGGVRVRVEMAGARAHTARPWMGRNAIHRMGPILDVVAGWEPRRPVLAGCEYHESLQAVLVDGGVAGNVVPDAASVTIHHRFAPDRSAAEALLMIEELLDPQLADGDQIVVVDAVSAASPAVDHPVLERFVARNGVEVRAKLGWTDVARLAEHGVPAVNFGPGDPTVAHTKDEHVTIESIEAVFGALWDLVTADGDD